MEIEVFPATQALTVVAIDGWVRLDQYDDGVGRDARVYIPVKNVEDAIRAIREAAEAAAEDLED